MKPLVLIVFTVIVLCADARAQVCGSVSAPVSYFGVQNEGSSLPSEATCTNEIAITAETITSQTTVLGQTTTNVPFNATVPTVSQMASFASNGYVFSPVSSNTQFARITAQYPLLLGQTPSTAMIIRMMSCMFGLDEGAMMAEAWEESWWQQITSGDSKTGVSNNAPILANACTGSTPCVCTENTSFTSPPCALVSPLFNTAIPMPDGNTIAALSTGGYQSWSNFQTKAFFEWMTIPEIWQSTTFADEYQGATLRTCMNGGYTSYMGGTTYDADVSAYTSNPTGTDANSSDWDFFPGLAGTFPAFATTNENRVMWGCIGTHFSGFGWSATHGGGFPTGTGQSQYMNHVQCDLEHQRWLTPSTHTTGCP